MGDGTTDGLLPNRFAQAHSGPFASAADTIAFREGFVAPEAPEAPFMQHQLDWMATQGYIAFATLAHIMLLDTDALTMGATRSVSGCDHFHPNAAIGLHDLVENAQPC